MKPIETSPLSLLRAYGIVCLAGAAIGLPLSLTATVVKTPTELHLSGDWDGDGRTDLAVVDRAGGGFRTAYQTAPETWVWADPRPSGLTDIQGAAVGRWFDIGRDGFAIASRDANRVRVLRVPDPALAPEITVISSLTALGPAALAAPDIGGGGNTVHDDLWVGYEENGAPDPFAHGAWRHAGIDFTDISTVVATRRPEQVRTLPLKEGGGDLVVFLASAPGQSPVWTALDYSSGAAVNVAETTLFLNSEWASGKLGAGTTHHLLTWQPGNLLFRAQELVEGPPDSFTPGAAEVFFIDMPIGQLLVVDTPAGARLVVLSPDGSEAGVYAFDGGDGPDYLQSIEAAVGDRIRAVLPLPEGGFQLMSGPGDSDFTSAHTRFEADIDGLFVPGETQTLPSIRPAALRANVFAFAGEILVDPQAVPLARFNAAEWSSGAVLAGDQLSVVRERFQSTVDGLGDDSLLALGSVAAGTTFALTNQMRENVSVHSFDAADGEIGIDASITPLPGPQTSAITVRLSATSPIAPIFYRINEGAWENWTGTGIYLGADSEIAFYARHPITNEPTPIRRAVYTFATPPHLLDSDGDGVPDFVERAYSIDPFGGVDSDGDGFSDLNELLLETDPTNANDKPDNSQRLEENIAFRLQAAPLAYDGATDLRTTPELGVRLEVHALDGTLLGGAESQALDAPGILGPGLNLNDVVADNRLELVTVLSEPVFRVQTTDPDKERGRELATFLPIPETEVPPVNYTPGNGTPAQEAAAWIAAAATVRDNLERPLLAANFTEIDTLAALMLEWKVETILVERGLAGLQAGKLTLFGGRTGDAARFAPDAQTLAALRLQAAPHLPGYHLQEMSSQLRSVLTDDAAFANARTIATAIYAASSANSNANPPGTYLPPFDVLRAFVRGEPLPEPYASEVPIASKAIEATQAQLLALRTDLSARPEADFMLRVEEDSFTGACRGLTSLGDDSTLYLFASPSVPYAFTDGFDLIPGTELLVRGYTDLDSDCGSAIEVISVSILSFPPVAFVDSENNLLPDDWEWALLLGLGNDPLADADDDKLSNLQEFLLGSDPLDGLAQGVQAVDLSPPNIAIFGFEEDGLALVWEFPAPYVDDFNWVFETSTDLVTWDIHPSAIIQETEPGLLSVVLPNEIELNKLQLNLNAYYRVRMSLKAQP